MNNHVNTAIVKLLRPMIATAIVEYLKTHGVSTTLAIVDHIINETGYTSNRRIIKVALRELEKGRIVKAFKSATSYYGAEGRSWRLIDAK